MNSSREIQNLTPLEVEMLGALKISLENAEAEAYHAMQKNGGGYNPKRAQEYLKIISWYRDIISRAKTAECKLDEWEETNQVIDGRNTLALTKKRIRKDINE